jgi:hypothetical protein
MQDLSFPEQKVKVANYYRVTFVCSDPHGTNIRPEIAKAHGVSSSSILSHNVPILVDELYQNGIRRRLLGRIHHNPQRTEILTQRQPGIQENAEHEATGRGNPWTQARLAFLIRLKRLQPFQSQARRRLLSVGGSKDAFRGSSKPLAGAPATA